MRHVFERNRARGTGLFTRRVIAAVATVAMLAGVGCVTASSAAAEDATGALEQQIEQPVLQESGQEDSQPVEQNLMVGEEQPSEQEQPSDQEAYQQVEQETEQETKEETEQWVEQEVEQQSEQQSEQPDEQPVTLSAQPIARANRAQSVAQNETGSQLGAPEKHKRIKKNNDGSYTVNVDVKGAASSTTVTTTQPIDFTLVLDVSGSMDGPMGSTDRTKRLDALKKAVDNFLDGAANANKGAQSGSEPVRVGLVKFSGKESNNVGNDMYRSGGYQYNYSQIVSKLTADMSGLKTKVNELKAAGSTRADNGFKRAVKVMENARTDAKKVVIFFADGTPSSVSDFDASVANGAVTAAKTLKDQGDMVYSIGIFASADPSSLSSKENQFMHAVSSNFPKAIAYNNRGGGDKDAGYYKAAKNASELNAIFDEIQKSETTTSAYTKVTMEDTLSGYVELADSNYKVVAKDASGKVVSLTKNVDYTLTYDASTKKFTVAFLKPLVNNVTYTLEYNVKPTQKAYDEYAANLNAGKDGYDGVKGDANTDLPGNATSSNQPGFHANDSACLAYSADGVDHACGGNPYPHPVIQVVSSTLHIEKQWSGDGDKPESITVDIKQGGNSYKTVTLKSDANGNWSTDVIIPAGAAKTYTVTETEPENHQWQASYQHKVGNGALADGNVVTVPESTASQNATVVITNTLKTATLKNAIGVKKELVGRDWKDSDEFTFKLKADDSNPDAPMPASCKNQSACTVMVKRDSSDDHVAYFGDITYDAGEAEYTYLVTENAGNASAMYYSQAEYRVVVSVMKDGTSGEWKAVVESVTQLKTDYGAAGSNWDETQPMLFTNQYISASSLPLTGRMGAERWWHCSPSLRPTSGDVRSGSAEQHRICGSRGRVGFPPPAIAENSNQQSRKRRFS